MSICCHCGFMAHWCMCVCRAKRSWQRSVPSTREQPPAVRSSVLTLSRSLQAIDRVLWSQHSGRERGRVCVRRAGFQPAAVHLHRQPPSILVSPRAPTAASASCLRACRLPGWRHSHVAVSPSVVNSLRAARPRLCAQRRRSRPTRCPSSTRPLSSPSRTR